MDFERRSWCSGGFGALCLLSLASCAPDPAWTPEQASAPGCVALRCTSSTSNACPASTERMHIALDTPVLRGNASGVALLPWTRQATPERCDRDGQCAKQGRCLRGACWRSPRSQSEIRRWFQGKATLHESLPGWRATWVAPQDLQLQTSQGVGEPGLWAVYLDASWTSLEGHPVGVSLEPLALVFTHSTSEQGGAR